MCALTGRAAIGDTVQSLHRLARLFCLVVLMAENPSEAYPQMKVGSNQDPFVEPTQVWHKEFAASMIPSTSRASAVVVDDEGNVFLGGSASGKGFLARFDAEGNLVWIVNEAALPQSIKSIVRTNDGALRVAGNRFSFGSGIDVSLAQYSLAGTRIWSIAYDSGVPTDGSSYPCPDSVVALCADSSGNVFVAAATGESPRSFALALSFDPAGTLRWTARVPSSKQYLFARAITVTRGLVAIATDQKIQAYSSSGSPLWMFDLGGEAVSVDDSGNVYVATLKGLSKYSFLGELRWGSWWGLSYISSGNHSTALTVAPNGLTYVGGWAQDATYDTIMYVTVCRDPSGANRWVSRRVVDSGRWHGNEYFAAEQTWSGLDSSGALSVAGWLDLVSLSGGATRWNLLSRSDRSGNFEWTILDSSTTGAVQVTGMDVRKNGDVVIAKTEAGRAVVEVYSRQGQRVWRWEYPSDLVPGTPHITATAVDPQTNVYATVDWSDPQDPASYNVACYSAAGAELWRARFDQVPRFIATTGAGNTVVSGSGPLGVTIAMFDSLGRRTWERARNRKQQNEYIRTMIVDYAGSTIFAGSGGWSNSSQYYISWFRQKYSVSGDSLWETYGESNVSAGKWRTYDKQVVADFAGSVFFLSSSSSDVQPPDIRVARLPSFGEQGFLWSYAGVKNTRYEVPVAMALDPWRGCFFLGREETYEFVRNTLILGKIPSEAQGEWVAKFQPPDNGQPIDPVAVCADSSGNAYVAAEILGSGATFDMVILKYDQSGRLVWERYYDGPGHGRDRPCAMHFDARGAILVGGTSETSPGDADFVILCYDTLGDLRWQKRYGSVPGQDDNLHDLRLALDGSLIAAGHSGGVAALIMYSDRSTVVAEGKIPAEYRLGGNYPNPCNLSTTIQYVLPSRSRVMLTVYNTLGQAVKELVNGEKEAGVHEVRFVAEGLASGVYLYRMQAGSYVETKKLILLR